MKTYLFFSNKRKSLFFLFLTALLFRIILIFTYQVDQLTADSVGYHKIGVNIMNGNGMSISCYAPFEKHYFREPVYPFFLALSCKLFTFLTDKKIEYLMSCEEHITGSYFSFNPGKHPEIFFIRFIQSFIDALSVIVLFLILCNFFSVSSAFIISFFYSFYYPVAIHVTYLLRETVQLFITLVMAYAFLKILTVKKKQWLWILFFSFFWSLSNLILQVTIVIPAVMLLFLYINKKSVLQSLFTVAVSIILMLLTISPWLIHIYHFYPDIRIIKTFGCSFTHEMLKYQHAVNILEKNRIITENEAKSMRQWNKNAKEQFRLSYDGTYTNFAKSVQEKYINRVTVKQRLVSLVTKFYKSWFKTKITFKGTKQFFNESPIIHGLLLGIPILIGILAFIGIYRYAKLIFPSLLTFSTFLFLFPRIGSEYRRMLPIQPFIFVFGILGAHFLINRYLLKKDD